MKYSRFLAAVAFVLAFATVAFVTAGVWPGMAHAADFGGLTIDLAARHTPSVVSSLADVISNHGHQMAVTLAVMRANLVDLEKRAADKLAELKDDTPAEQARQINDDHKKILTEAEQLRADIKKKEDEGGDDVDPPAPIADGARAADIFSIGTRAGMESTAIEAAIRANESLDTFRTRAFDHMVQRQNGTVTTPARIQTDERETRRAAQIEAMSYRFGAPMPEAGPSAAARGYMDHGVVSLAAEAAGYRGFPRNARDIEGIFERAAHTTSDFPIIMEGAINRTLETRYALAQPTYRRIARQRNFRDFRPHTSITPGDFPMLKPVLEDGEIKFGTISEGKETISVASYARAISFTRQVLINDDIGFIQDTLSSYGTTVALFEEVLFYSQALNGKLADGKTVFHADHGNLAAAGAAPSVETVSTGRAGMAKQKNRDGNALMANRPATILTGPDNLTAAEVLVATIVPGTVAAVNIFSGRLTPIDTAQLANDWYLFPSTENGSNYRWGYLEGYEAPRVRIENPFGRQGMAMSVEHDFGCGPVDFRFGWKNPGQPAS